MTPSRSPKPTSRDVQAPVPDPQIQRDRLEETKRQPGGTEGAVPTYDPLMDEAHYAHGAQGLDPVAHDPAWPQLAGTAVHHLASTDLRRTLDDGRSILEVPISVPMPAYAGSEMHLG